MNEAGSIDSLNLHPREGLHSSSSKLYHQYVFIIWKEKMFRAPCCGSVYRARGKTKDISTTRTRISIAQKTEKYLLTPKMYYKASKASIMAK